MAGAARSSPLSCDAHATTPSYSQGRGRLKTHRAAEVVQPAPSTTTSSHPFVPAALGATARFVEGCQSHSPSVRSMELSSRASLGTGVPTTQVMYSHHCITLSLGDPNRRCQATGAQVSDWYVRSQANVLHGFT